MSGRIRTIKPELLEDAVTAGLSDTAFRIFTACILLADDYGNFRADPEWLRCQIHWRVPPSKPFDEALQELPRLIEFYGDADQQYGHIRKWEKHQKISHRGKPRIPGPPSSSGDPPEPLRRPSGVPPEGLRPDLRSPTTITDHHGDAEGVSERSEAKSEIRLRQAEPEPGVTPIRTEAAAQAVADEYADAMAKELGGFALEAFPKPAIKSAVNGHAPPGLSGDELRARIRYSVTLYARHAKANDQFEGGKQPKNWLAWLNKNGNGTTLAKPPPTKSQRRPSEHPQGLRPLKREMSASEYTAGAQRLLATLERAQTVSTDEVAERHAV